MHFHVAGYKYSSFGLVSKRYSSSNRKGKWVESRAPSLQKLPTRTVFGKPRIAALAPSHRFEVRPLRQTSEQTHRSFPAPPARELRAPPLTLMTALLPQTINACSATPSCPGGWHTLKVLVNSGWPTFAGFKGWALRSLRINHFASRNSVNGLGNNLLSAIFIRNVRRRSYQLITSTIKTEVA
jgi:hypothetical protein